MSRLKLVFANNCRGRAGLVVLALGLAFGWNASAVIAQSTSLFGSSGPIGRQASSRGASSSSLGTSSFGSTGGSRTGSMGGRGGAGGNNVGGLGSTSQPAQFGALSQTIGQGFIGQSDNLGRFVGGPTAGQTGGMTTFNARGGGFGGARGRTATPFNAAGQSGQDDASLTGRSARAIRPQHRIAFSYIPRTDLAINTKLRTQVQRASIRRPALRNVTVGRGGDGVVTLTGTVADADAKKLAEAMVRLEPGVQTIRNELQIQPTPPVNTNPSR